MTRAFDDIEQVAGNGLLHRRLFLTRSAALLGVASLPFGGLNDAHAGPQSVPEWMQAPGAGMSPYGHRSKYESHVLRSVSAMPSTTGNGASRTPLESLEGIITPNALHYERHHSGVPDIDPDRHRLLIHGLVERPLLFSVDALLRYPRVSRIHFLECSGNSGANNAPEAPQLSAGGLHGLVSCSDWTGIPLGVLLEEAGVRPEAKWLLAEGGDAAAMSRSIPLAKATDDALLGLFQNGERLRPEQGYPMRLLLPGWEGNTNVKWLRRIELTAGPVMTKDETSKYTDLMPDGRARMFTFPMQVKSVITSPSGGLELHGPGLYQISGIAWSGAGRIRRVDVSADGGRSWGQAELSEPVLPKALTRFRMAWRWNGGPAILQSRAVDETGAVQPTRAALIGERGSQYRYHYHAIQSWSVSAAGRVGNVYA